MKNDYEVVSMEPIERQIWRHPLTSIATLLFSCAIAAALIYTFAFTDNSKEILEHASKSLVVIASLGLFLAFVKKREAKGILPRWLRATVWTFIIIVYIGLVALFFAFPNHRDSFMRLSLSIKLGSLGILPVLAWRLLRDKSS